MDASTLTTLQTVAIASVLAWASGIRLYATLFVVGGAAYLGWVTLPGDLATLSHPILLWTSGLLFLVEFLADKVPGLDSAWDAVHTFIRIPAGAILAAGAATGLSSNDLSAVTIAAGLLGGTIAAGTHFTKAGTRALINTSPEPVSNVATSLAEDATLLGGLWLAFAQPWVFLALLAVFLLLAAWLLPKLWRFIAAIGRKVLSIFGLARPAAGRT